jgi:hypothetical protein
VIVQEGVLGHKEEVQRRKRQSGSIREIHLQWDNRSADIRPLDFDKHQEGAEKQKRHRKRMEWMGNQESMESYSPQNTRSYTIEIE